MKKGLKQQFQNKFEYKARRQGLAASPQKPSMYCGKKSEKRNWAFDFADSAVLVHLLSIFAVMK